MTDAATIGSKVLVLGCPGAGKSTLAREIAKLSGLPLVHLDRHFWRPGWREPDKEVWKSEVAGLVARPAWVIDGNYGSTLPLRLAAADSAVLLDFPAWLCLARVLRRELASLGRVRADMAPGCPERFDPTFLIYVWRYRRTERERHLASLAGFGGRLVTLRRPAEAAAFIADLAAARARATAAGPVRCGSRPGLR